MPDPCYALRGISIFRGNVPSCTSDAELTFMAWGDGTAANSFQWILNEIDAQDRIIPNTTSWYNGGDPSIHISLINPFKRYNLSVTVLSCSKQFTNTPPFNFSLSQLLGDPGSVLIAGPSNVWGLQGDYYVNGSYWLNPNTNTINWLGNSNATVTSGQGTAHATYTFGTKTCTTYGWWTMCYPLSIAVSSVSPCLDVNGNQYINYTGMSVYSH